MAASGSVQPVPRPPAARLRRAGVLALVAGLAGVHLLAVAAGREAWPVSHYPMYARPSSPTWHESRLYAVPADGGAERPLDPATLGLRRVDVRHAMRHHGDSAATDRILAELASIYESRRLAGRHDGPPLAGLRLCRDGWSLAAGDPPARAPDEHRVLADHSPPRAGVTPPQTASADGEPL